MSITYVTYVKPNKPKKVKPAEITTDDKLEIQRSLRGLNRDRLKVLFDDRKLQRKLINKTKVYGKAKVLGKLNYEINLINFILKNFKLG